jgi:hypothetical protein
MLVPDMPKTEIAGLKEPFSAHLNKAGEVLIWHPEPPKHVNIGKKPSRMLVDHAVRQIMEAIRRDELGSEAYNAELRQRLGIKV